MSELILYQNRILMESNKNVEALTNLNNSRDDIVDQVTTLESLVKVRFHAQMPLRKSFPPTQAIKQISISGYTVEIYLMTWVREKDVCKWHSTMFDFYRSRNLTPTPNIRFLYLKRTKLYWYFFLVKIEKSKYLISADKCKISSFYSVVNHVIF